jgi:opacity protein-like surface antigen
MNLSRTLPKYATLLSLTALSLYWSAGARAEREPGWDFGVDLIWQDATDISFEHGSKASLDDDLGLALSFGYRFNSRLELLFSLDWNTIGYDIDVANETTPSLGFSARGDLEAFTPRIGANFNLLKGDLTPYVTAAVGWAFIDTNIPNGPTQTSCWWDPWWGYYCGTWQNTRNVDELTYDVGLGVRWDIGDALTLRLGYEKHWLDAGEAKSTPDFDQIKFGIAARY